MQIDPKNNLQVNPVNRLQNEQQPAAKATPTAVSVNNDAPASQVSAFSHAVAESYKALSEHDSVDMAKVQQLKLAIANGELKLDDDAIVSAMLDMHKR
ncbi:flagellar biosynthesis anti-sigma factor FlgM [Rheinheimera sp. YQF-2]|jgi:negative regulator of flagellin synthesis FlgM|uniref:Negative regulator of flagellin synthesis n=1 Tax=Rheinheimera lutimaris TaxID=2740584 RepID=A0A7Y5EJ20_9GAMM|nr:flagellar biosynthesis anti-sigma factor FlgM [Rheinheimera lutimaris]NRQ42931.1 flagellar biosynthesis anti-sigma factor FlgM [Rheinheimera lutimaris]